jgi:hypothetical protein
MPHISLLTDSELLKLHDFVQCNLKSCCKDLRRFKGTGILLEGNFKECVNMVPDHLNQLEVAEDIISRLAIYAVAHRITKKELNRRKW